MHSADPVGKLGIKHIDSLDFSEPFIAKVSIINTIPNILTKHHGHVTSGLPRAQY